MAILAANWKMNGSLALVQAFADAQSYWHESLHELIFFPPFPLITPLQQALPNQYIGAQNVSDHEQGAYTGEVSAVMLQEQGVTHVIVGHSERRQYYGESNNIVAAKAIQAQAHGLVPVICIGEKLSDRENQITNDVLALQLQALVDAGVTLAHEQCLIAYEPVWAIGTGLAASPEDIAKAHLFIHEYIAQRSSATALPALLYGGSVNVTNLASIIAVPYVSGALIGGASLKVDEFAKMTQMLSD